MRALVLNLPSVWSLSDEQFRDLVAANRDMRLELSAKGKLLIMPPTGGETGNRNFELYLDLGNWNRRTQLGKAFDSSTGFQLPNGAKRSPDLSWITLERWERLTPQERKGFLPLCPDFVVELASESDDIAIIEGKMEEYLSNGLCLGWLIIPKTETVKIYRPRREIEVLRSPSELSGENILPGFVVNLRPIWEI